MAEGYTYAGTAAHIRSFLAAQPQACTDYDVTRLFQQGRALAHFIRCIADRKIDASGDESAAILVEVLTRRHAVLAALTRIQKHDRAKVFVEQFNENHKLLVSRMTTVPTVEALRDLAATTAIQAIQGEGDPHIYQKSILILQVSFITSPHMMCTLPSSPCMSSPRPTPMRKDVVISRGVLPERCVWMLVRRV